MREGAESGKVTVQFAQSGKSYRISRGLKRRGKAWVKMQMRFRGSSCWQIIAVTHSDAFAEEAEHVIKLGKEAGVSKVSIER